MLRNVIRIIEGHHLTSLLPKWRYSVMHTLMRVGDTPVVKYDLALWPLSLYSEDSEFYSLDLRACAVFYKKRFCSLVLVMLLSALLDSWSHMRGS